MNQASIKKNYVYRTLYEILKIVTGLVSVPYISRVLEADGVGIYSYTSSVMTYFTLFASLGTITYGAREIAQHRDDRKQSSKLFWEIELMTILSSLICLAAWGILIMRSNQYRYYYIALIPTLVGTMADISWYFTGLEQIKCIVNRSSICKILGLVLLFSLVHEKDDILIYTLITSFMVLLGNLSMWTYLPKMLVKVDWKKIKIRKHFKETLIYFIPTVATSVYTVLDKTLIGLITNDSCENGYYEQVTNMVNIAKAFVYTSVNAVVGTRNSYLFSVRKYDEMKEKINNSMDFIILMGIGSVCGIIGVASRFVPLFLGKGYEPVIFLLQIMSPIIIIIGISNCIENQYFIPSGQRGRSAKIIIFGAIVNFVMNLILIPAYESGGAIIASLIAESVITLLYVRMSDGYMTFSVLRTHMKKRIVAGIIMCLVVMVLGEVIHFGDALVLFVQIVVGIGIYGVLLLIMKDNLLQELIVNGLKSIKSKI